MNRKLAAKLSIFSICSASLFFCDSAGADNDSKIDAGTLYVPLLKLTAHNGLPCAQYLERDWSSFTFASGEEYDREEKRHVEGAAISVLCGIKSGMMIHMALGRLKKLAQFEKNPTPERLAVLAQKSMNEISS